MKIRNMSFWLFLLLAIVLFFVQGCGRNNISRFAEERKVALPETQIIDREMEDVITDIFSETGYVWDKAMLETIDSALAGLNEESYYMYSIIQLGSSVPYYELRATTNRTLRLINKLKKQLDEMAAIPGAVNKIGKYAYDLTVEKVLLAARSSKANLARIEGSINDDASAADIADLKKLYDTMAPLFKTAMVAL